MPNFYSHLTNIVEEEDDEKENSVPVHPLFEQEVQGSLGVPLDFEEQRRISSKDDMFYSVSERSVSLEYGLESHLTSISEESDVFFTNNPGQSISSSIDLKCDSSLLKESVGSGCGLESNSGCVDEGDDQEVLIQFLPHVVNIGDHSYEYSSGSCTPESEVFIVLENNKDEMISLNAAVLDDPHCEQPKLSSTPCRVSSRPNSRHSLVPSRTTGYPEGTYIGKIKHKDGSLMSVVFEVSNYYMYMYITSVSTLIMPLSNVCRNYNFQKQILHLHMEGDWTHQ